MVLLPPAGTTWHRHSSLSAAPGHRLASAGSYKAVPSPVQLTHHLLGVDTVQMVGGLSFVPLQNDRDDLWGTTAALGLSSRCQ